MKLLYKVMVWALLVTVASPGVLMFGSTQAPPQKAAGCHEHGRRAPGPVTYQCCRAGHRVAAVREAVELRTPFLVLSSVVEFAVFSSLRPAGQDHPKTPAFSPPSVTSLRI
ncbi:MAG: hypothetical protein WBX03_11740 [Terriglobales bacterium]|jgi:hypothetical protein